jgi:tetratricopeptide (TPR) repeat protein
MIVRLFALRLSTLALLLAAALAGCQSDQAKLAEHMSRGDKFAEEKKHPEAIIEYRSVLQIDPNHAPAHYALAKEYLRNNQPREGFWELRETVRLDPANLEARITFAQLAVLAGEPEEALAQAEAVLAADPKHVQGWLMKGQALEALKKPDESLAAVEKAVEMGPTDPTALRLMARAYDIRNDAPKAEAIYKRLLEASPDMTSHTSYARFLTRNYKAARTQEVEQLFRKAIEVAKPDETADAYAALSGYLFGRDRFDEVVTLLDDGIKKNDGSVELIYLLARYYSARGDETKARELIEQATQTKPNDPKPYLILSAYRGRQNDTAGALAAAEKAIEVAPDYEAARLRKAELLVEIGFADNDQTKIADGRKIIDEILAGQPSNPGALFIQAKIDLASKRVDESITAIRTAINGKPNWAEAYYVLGAALAIKGDNPAARNELARALEIDPNLLQAQQALAKVHASLGEHAYAVEVGRRYLKQRPDDLDMHLIVAQSLVRLGKLQEAKAEIDAIDEDKRGAEGNYALGRIYLGIGDLAQARKYLELADAALPRNADILSNLLTLDSRENRMAESVARINAAVAAEPGSSKLQQLAGMVAQMNGKPEEAEAAYKKAVELDPTDLNAYERLARFYSATGRLEETVKTYEKAIEVRPDQATLHHFLGVLYELGGQRDRALARYEEAIRLDPNLGEAKNNLAYLFAESGQNLDRALDLAQEAKTQLPDNASVADTLGWVLYKRDIPSAAISYLKEAEAGTDPNDASIGIVRYHLALAYDKNGDSDQARDALDRALAGLDKQQKAARAKGLNPPEPPWAKDVRAMRERLSSSAKK